TRIGGDVVEAVLGSGGFATVYRVRSPEGYVSALKLPPLDQGPERAARAWRELSLGTRLPSRASWARANGPRTSRASSG
ncbi:MAG TPA: hypothetical protein VEZ71_05900, partial [Archangium sp.]|nr:hypothetical protein [Archangium sp.]